MTAWFCQDMALLLDLVAIKIAGTLLIVLLSWRLWRFTIRPRFHPTEPKELPYWIPFIGHALNIFRDFNSTISRGVKYFQHTNEPFTITIAGEQIHVATSAEDINAVWNNTKTLSLDPISMGMYTRAGLPEKARKALFQTHTSARYNAKSGHDMTPTEMVQEHHKQQLHNGPKLDALMTEKLIPGLIKHLNFSDHSHPAVMSRSGPSVIISLFDLCVKAFIAEDTDVYFGPILRQIAPDVVSAFVNWEYTNWKFIMQLPAFLAKDMLNCKGTIVDAFEVYYKLPRSQRPGASHFVVALEDMLQEAGLTEREMGQFTFLHYWALVGNTYKLAFWLLAHLLHNPTLLYKIREEVLPAVKNDHIDETYLLKRCPALDSLINEILRLTVSTSLARCVISPCTIGNKTLLPGRKIMLPISALHYEQSVWGPSPLTLQPDRFVLNPKLAKCTSYRPWGGGSTMCPGRFFARRSVNAVVAILLARYDMEVVSGNFPEMDGARPSPGIAPVVRGQDVKVRCTPRG
ncbi:putative cytochrome P450 [Macroventuria anomochaeta]|uniref:Cytochrome P450 n=1 Tax=Macroventuria anomochaeta TaxID=301207 RepID=A0ACB6RZ62_9PLEO|nr:putative cytochrome P450 [Macroventuria anomochaeta]KAF2626547.1 putative cytochrome P450 [Macroventuria anomochaeta]